MDQTIVTAVTPGYLKKLTWTLPTWRLKYTSDTKLVIFTHGVSSYKLRFIKRYFPNYKIVPWEMKVYDNERELMLSSFVLGVEHIDTSHFIKIDADCFFLTSQAVFEEEDYKYDIVGHKWGYTKPGVWIPILQKFALTGERDFSLKYNNRTYAHERIASFICLHKTDFVKKIAAKFNGRLPVPSHDTVMWFFANQEGSWKAINVKRRGCSNNSNWKNIREDICSCPESADNDFLNSEIMKYVQLEITTDCNVKCGNCDRACGLIPSKENMSLKQIWSFVNESLELGHKWARIDIIGGEPTLHPNLKEILDYIKIYKNRYPKCKIRLSTNGCGDKVQSILKTIPDWVSVRDSSKKSSVQEFVAYNSAPVDNGIKDIRYCSVPWRCGMGLSRYGYFPCGAGAAVARIFKFDIGKKRLKDVNNKDIFNQLNKLCMYCGHARVKTRHLTKVQETSKTWKEAIDNRAPGEMDLY